jgi:hypothetical protein
MITEPQIIPMLVAASPSFQAEVNAHRAEFEEELIYLLMGDFARLLLQLHREGRTAEFPAVSQVIERLHIDGDPFVREVATIGLLEGIQNNWEHSDVDPELFGKYLQPESRKWWDELNAFWRGDRNYVGEGLQRELTPDDIRTIS